MNLIPFPTAGKGHGVHTLSDTQYRNTTVAEPASSRRARVQHNAWPGIAAQRYCTLTQRNIESCDPASQAFQQVGYYVPVKVQHRTGIFSKAPTAATRPHTGARVRTRLRGPSILQLFCYVVCLIDEISTQPTSHTQAGGAIAFIQLVR